MVLAPERGGRVISLLLTGAAAAVVSGLLTGLIRQYARRTRLLDVPNVRSSHQAPTPRGGGLAIVIVTALALGILGLSGALERHSALALAGALPVAGAGWLDDRHGLGAGTRAAVQVACASWALLWLGTGGSPGSLGAGLPAGAVGLGVGVLGIVWLSNLYNFMDGIDGIAGGQAAATGAVMTFLLARGGDMGLALLAAVIAGASLGFLIWNWSPALIFMGDVGSGFLGFIFGAIAVAGAREGAVPLLAWLPLFAVFLVDATVTLLRRVGRGDRWYAAHRSHAYQRAVQSGLPHATVSGIVIGFGLAAGAAAGAALAAGQSEVLSAVAGTALGGAAALYLLVERRRPMTQEPGAEGVPPGTKS
jgi:Fuc2NAc and GlcNAc transferase